MHKVITEEEWNKLPVNFETDRVNTGYRAAYIKRYGPLLEGYEIHHLCDDHNCINTDHLIAVSKEEHDAIHDMGMIQRRLVRPHHVLGKYDKRRRDYLLSKFPNLLT